jgi:coupling of ubiquitin conjugation to ER degradation protein 1
MAEQTLNVPQLIVFIIVTVLAVRWFFSKPNTTTSTQAAPGARAATAARINPAQIDQISQMFPQADRRAIAWDLQRNGGNVAATTEWLINGRTLQVVSSCYAILRLACMEIA